MPVDLARGASFRTIGPFNTLTRLHNNSSRLSLRTLLAITSLLCQFPSANSFPLWLLSHVINGDFVLLLFDRGVLFPINLESLGKRVRIDIVLVVQFRHRVPALLLRHHIIQQIIVLAHFLLLWQLLLDSDCVLQNCLPSFYQTCWPTVQLRCQVCLNSSVLATCGYLLSYVWGGRLPSVPAVISLVTLLSFQAVTHLVHFLID